MASLFDWSSTAGSNGSIDGINVAEGCPAGNINGVIRSMAAIIRQTFASGLQSFLSGSSALAIANGGTGGTSAAAARSALDVYSTGQVNSLVSGGVPAGAVVPFAMSSAPSGWLECDGSAVSRGTYAALFTAIGTTFGTGDGSSTFNLPDLRGEFVRGWDHGRGVDSGRALGSAQSDQIEAHKHVVPWGEAGGSYAFGTIGGGGKQGQNGGQDFDNNWMMSNDGSDYAGTTVNASGVIGAETRPRNVALMYCIKAS